MTTARASKLGELLVKRFELGSVTPECVATIIDEAAGLAELERDYADMTKTVITTVEKNEELIYAIRELLADDSNGAARHLAEMALVDATRSE